MASAPKSSNPKRTQSKNYIFIMGPREVLAQITSVERNANKVLELQNDNPELGSRRFEIVRQPKGSKTA